MTGSGTITGRSVNSPIPVEITLTPTATAVYAAEGANLRFTNTVAIITLAMTMGGAPVALPSIDSSGASVTMPVRCTATELFLTVSIPAGPASPARTVDYRFLKA